MSPELAAHIAKNFSVVTQIETGGLSSFDATVWRANTPSGSADPNGKLYVTMRGTQETADFLVDINLAVTGSAQAQLVSMVNWWLSISTPVGQSATQIRTAIGGGMIGQFFEAAPSVPGTGLIAASNLIGGIEVNGHSLGGYLATAFTRLFGSQAHVTHTSTFNSAGFAPGSEAVFTNLQNLIGPSYGLGRFPSQSEQTNYFAKNGLNITTNSFWFSQQGQRVELFNETDTTQLGNHFMYKLTDSMALGNALQKLDSTFTVEKLKVLLELGSNKTEASLEGIVDSVRFALQGTSVSTTLIGDVAASASSRLDFHKNLDEFQNLPLFASLAGKLIIKPTDASAVRSSARNNFGALVALQDLSPISISAINPAADALLTAVWQSTRATDYAAWTADKSTTAPSAFTDKWIEDRSTLVQALGTRNRQDNTANAVFDPIAPANKVTVFHFTDPSDPATETILSTQRAGVTGLQEQHFLFGNDQSNTLTGYNNLQGDHLYGGAGADFLNGQGGNDYEEGGAGFDTYQFTAQFGKDTILDADGLGLLQVDGATLTTSKGAGRNVWLGKDSAGNTEGYAVYDDPRSSTGKKLVITRAGNTDNTITIDNFNLTAALGATGYLGLKLDPAKQLALIQGNGTTVGATTANVWADVNFQASSLVGKQSDITEGTGKSFTLNLNQGAKAGDTVTLALSSQADKFKAILGDSVVDANGAVITLAEGQTQVSFALVQQGEVTADASLQLSANYNGTTQTATSNTWAINLKDTGPTTSTRNGDQRAKLIGLEIDTHILPGDPLYNTYKWSATSWAADGTLSAGVAEPNFSDVIDGTASNDKLTGAGGNDALSGGAGNDEIDGGAGDDLMGGGAGSDKITGGDGNDYINSSATLNVQQRLSPTDTWSPPGGQVVKTQGALWGIYIDTQSGSPITIWSGSDNPAGTDGDNVDGGAGNDNIIASGGEDRVQGGTGDDTIDGMGGADVLEGGDGKDTVQGDGILKAGYMNSLAGQFHGSDFLDGGAGDDTLTGGGGSDVIYGGADNDQMWGDASGLTSAADYLGLAYHGADYMDGEDGDDYMEGGGNSDTLYGGAGADTMWGDTSASNVDAASNNAMMWGDDYLGEEEGNDQLQRANGSFDCEHRCKRRNRKFVKSRNCYARSKRLAGLKRLARRMDIAWAEFHVVLRWPIYPNVACAQTIDLGPATGCAVNDWNCLCVA